MLSPLSRKQLIILAEGDSDSAVNVANLIYQARSDSACSYYDGNDQYRAQAMGLFFAESNGEGLNNLKAGDSRNSVIGVVQENYRGFSEMRFYARF